MTDYNDTILRVIGKITDDPDSIPSTLWGVLLNVDNSCKSATTERCRYKPLCIQCKELSLLSDMQLERPFIIECGMLMGTWMKISKSDVLGLEVEIDIELKDETLRLIGAERKMLECGTPDSTDVTFLKCDPVTCNILVSWLVDSALGDGYWLMSAYKCSDAVYRLTRIRHSLLDLHGKINCADALSIVVQTILMLRRLSEYHFVHGNPSPMSLRLAKDPVSKSVDGVHVNGGYKVGLDPGDHSSITSWKTRVCSGNRKWRGTVLTPMMENKFVVSKVTLYTIPREAREMFMNRRASGIPIYPGSLDLYCIIIGLICNPLFEAVVMRMGWTSLWVKAGDAATVIERVKLWRCGSAGTLYPSNLEIMTMLEGLWLRCDAVELMWRNIRIMV